MSLNTTRRNLKRIGMVGAAALVASGMALPHAHAAATFTITMNALPSPVTVGQTETVTVIINNTGPAASLTGLQVNGACTTGTPDPGGPACPNGDGIPNVLTLGQGTGVTGTACAGVTFMVGPPTETATSRSRPTAQSISSPALPATSRSAAPSPAGPPAARQSRRRQPR